MPTTIELLDQSIALLQESTTLQREAQQSIGIPPPSEIVTVTPGQSFASVLEQLAGGEMVVVSPEVFTRGDLTLTKPVHLAGASIRGRLDVQAPDCYFLGCSLVGPDENGALLSTADRLTVHGCRLEGSGSGQHRGIWVRSADVTILDTSITNCWKGGQDSQSIAGWSGVKRLRVERCLLEAASENFILGGTDCAEADIPEFVTVKDCYLRKPNEWRGWAGAKNLLELKNCKHVTIDHCLMEYSWVEGQDGYALMLTVRNQEGSAPWSTIEDVVIKNCTFRNLAGGVNILGSDYTHPSQTMKHVLLENNRFERIDPYWGTNGRCILFAHGGEDITFRGNDFSGVNINSAITFGDGAPVQRLTVEGNVMPEGWYGIKADDTALGTPALEAHAPGYTWTNNTIVRSVASNNIPYPPGTTIMNQFSTAPFAR